MVAKITNIADFPGIPGQRPAAGAPTNVGPVQVILVNSPLDRDYENIAIDTAHVDQFITDEINAGRAREFQVERWSPWSPLQLEVGFTEASRYNYARMAVDGRHWYAFLDVDYLNRHSSTFTPTPDDWTTYGPRIGYSMVVRGHVAVAASAAGDTRYCLEPEPYAPGDLIGYSGYTMDPLGSPRVLVTSTTDLTADGFVPVEPGPANTATDLIYDTKTSGTITAPGIGNSIDYSYNVGSDQEDPFYYPYAESPGLSAGNTMYRPRAVGSTPSMIDGIAAEGGAYLYPSVGAAIAHLSRIAHMPWLADGIQRAVLIPGGSGGGGGAINLSPRDSKIANTGGPSYAGSLSTAVGYDHTLTGDWLAGLPAAYRQWTKLRTGPYSAVEIADRQGSTSSYDPQTIVGLGALRLHVEGAFHPQADVAVWLVGAGGTAAPGHPMNLPLATELPHFAVGRDQAVGSSAAPLATERAQSIVDMLTTMQRAGVENTFTLSSAYTATQYAIAEAI